MRHEATSNRKFISIVLGALLLAFNYSAEGQQPKKVPRIGYLINSPLAASAEFQDAFRQGLRDLGYIEGKNIVIEWRSGEQGRDRQRAIAAEFVRLNVDVIVAGGSGDIRAAREATSTIPIVMVIGGDVIGSGFVDSLAHPGGNVTGVTRLTRDLSGKRLELLKDAVPAMTRVGVLFDEGPKISLKEYETTARALKIQFQSFGVRAPNPDLDGAFQAAIKARTHALIVIHNSLIVRYPNRTADLAIKNRLPSMYEESQYTEADGLMSYSANNADSYKRAAVYVDKILKGAKPAELPVEQPTKFELVINLKTAKQIGLTIPPAMLLRANRVIR